LFTYEDPPPVERTAYAGVLACILALVGIFRMFSKDDTNLRLFVFFNILLVVLTLSTAFGLLPHQLIEALPVFKNNPKWGRLLVLTLLGLAVLSAIGLDFGAAKLQSLSGRFLRLTPLNARRMIAVALVVIIAVQFHSQKTLFNRFNAVVPSSWFYPLTPSIKYVKDHLQPLQSVIADYSFLFCGTLGAYGIPEWYAHSFRTDREKEVLSRLVYDPFSSATSAFINSANIQFNSPLMDKLVIKYLLANKGALGMKRLFALPELSRDPAPPLPHNSWKQHIYIPNDMVVEAIGFLFVTSGEAHAPADVRLSLYTDKGEKYAYEPELGRDKIANNQWAFFEFPDRFSLRKGGYYLVVSLPGYTGPKGLTAWATKNQENTGSFLEINGVRTDYSLTWKIGYIEKIDSSAYEKKWNIIDLENEIVIFENKQVTNSAYFVKNLDPSNERLDFSGLDVTQTSVDRIDIHNSQPDAGWIVLPMHLHPGWKAYVDTRQVRYDKYLGILPAIPVSGASHVLFKFEPEFFSRGLMISLSGAIIFLVFSGFCFRKIARSDRA